MAMCREDPGSPVDAEIGPAEALGFLGLYEGQPINRCWTPRLHAKLTTSDQSSSGICNPLS